MKIVCVLVSALLSSVCYAGTPVFKENPEALSVLNTAFSTAVSFEKESREIKQINKIEVFNSLNDCLQVGYADKCDVREQYPIYTVGKTNQPSIRLFINGYPAHKHYVYYFDHESIDITKEINKAIEIYIAGVYNVN